MMTRKAKMLLFVKEVPVDPERTTIPKLCKAFGLSYPRIYDIVSQFSFISELAEDDDKGLFFPTEEAKERIRLAIINERNL